MFIPVSGGDGSGEVGRCAIIARHLLQQAADLELHCVLGPGVGSHDFPSWTQHPLSAGPTQAPGEVEALLQEVRPQVVIFDSTLRVSTLTMAKRDLGATTIYISSRPDRRRRGMAIKRLRLLDEHWIFTHPAAHALFWTERLRMAILGHRPSMLFMTAVLPRPLSSRQVLSQLGRSSPAAIVCVSGGGGGSVHGIPVAETFHQAACTIAAALHCEVMHVIGPQGQRSWQECHPSVHEIQSLPPDQLIAVLEQAALVVCGGGSLLAQVLALGKPCVATAAAGADQARRVRALAAQGLVVAAPCQDRDVSNAAIDLWRHPERCQELRDRAKASGYTDGLPMIAERIERLRAAQGAAHAG